jgi:hypothetical protein
VDPTPKIRARTCKTRRFDYAECAQRGILFTKSICDTVYQLDENQKRTKILSRWLTDGCWFWDFTTEARLPPRPLFSRGCYQDGMDLTLNRRDRLLHIWSSLNAFFPPELVRVFIFYCDDLPFCLEREMPAPTVEIVCLGPN